MTPEGESSSFRLFVPFVLMIGLMGVLTGMVVTAPKAAASDGRLLVSRSVDGPWQPSFTTPLFQRAGALVPLDRATSRFYVRNGSSDAARASVSWTVSGAGEELARSLRFSVALGGATEPSGQCGARVASGSIPPGGVQRVDVEMLVADLAAGLAMRQTADVTMELRLEQVAAREPRDPCTTDSPPGTCLSVVGDGCSGTVPGAASPAASGPLSGSAGAAVSGADVPTVVDAGVAGEEEAEPPAIVREAGRVFGLALAAFLAGVLLLVASRWRPAPRTMARPNENLF